MAEAQPRKTGPRPDVPLRLAAALVREDDRRLARRLAKLACRHPTWTLADARTAALEHGLPTDALARLHRRCEAHTWPDPPGAEADLETWAERVRVSGRLGARFPAPLDEAVTLRDALLGRFTTPSDGAGIAQRADVLASARYALGAEAEAQRLWRAAAPAQASEAADVLAAAATRGLPALAGSSRIEAEQGELVFTPVDDVEAVVSFSLWRLETPRCASCGEACAHTREAAAAFLDLLAAPTAREADALERAASADRWQRALRGLEGIADAGGPSSPYTWRVAGDGPALTLSAHAEGRPVAPGTVLYDEEADDADQEAAFALRATADDDAGEAVARALWCLADTGRVRDERDAALVVVRGRPELLVEESERGAFTVQLALDGCALPREADASRPLVLRVPGRVVVTRADRAVKPLADAVQELPARFPSSARAGLLERLVELERRVPVRLPAALEGPEVAATPRLAARLTPVRAGLRVEVGVYPVTGAPWLPPGEGPQRVSAVRDGVRVRAARDVAGERAVAREITAGHGLARAEEVAPWVWLLEGRAAGPVLDALAQASDVRVEWPAGAGVWAEGRPAEPEDLAIRVRRGRDWFALDGEVRVDEDAVSLQRLVEAARAGRRFVPLGDGRFLQLSEALSARLTRAAPALFEHGSELRAGKASVPLVDEALFGDGAPAPDEAWEELLERVRVGRSFRPAPPAGLQAELRPYQRGAFEWLARLCEWGAGGCLADEMGLGKTLMTLTLLLHRAERGPALVIAPTSVCFNWAREAAKFTPTLRVQTPSARERGDCLRDAGPHDVVVLSYGALVQAADELAELPFATLVLDEAQAIKNPQTRRARAVRRLRADARVALSGTPVENHLGELWSLFAFINPGLLGTWPAFFKRFAAPIERDDDDVARASLQRLVRPFLLRRTKREVARELPPRTDVEVLVELSDGERALYEAVRRHVQSECSSAAEADPDVARVRVLAALTRLRRLACHPRLDDPASEVPSTKLERTLHVLDEVQASGGSALVFSQFTSHLALVQEALLARGRTWAYLDGSTPMKERERQVDRFQNGEVDLFLISLKAGGTGLTLTAADTVLHLDPWWNPAVEDQASDRAHRIGQLRPVTVVRMIARQTIEERVLALHGEKRKLTQAVLDGADRPLDTDELLALLAAAPGA